MAVWFLRNFSWPVKNHNGNCQLLAQLGEYISDKLLKRKFGLDFRERMIKFGWKSGISISFHLKKNSFTQESYIGNTYFGLFLYSQYPILQSRKLRDMASRSKHQVENISNQMEGTNISSASVRPLRRLVTSAQAVTDAADNWSTSLLGKVFAPSILNYAYIKKEVNNLWKQHNRFQIQTIGPNFFIFQLPSVEAQTDILKRAPLVVLRHLLALQRYNPAIQLKDHLFTHQIWRVKLMGINALHLSEQVLEEIFKDIGRKVEAEDGYRIPRDSLLTTAYIEVALKEPLRRGGWICTIAGEKKWVIYHFDMQPKHICKKCFTIDHDKEKCKVIEQEFLIERMTDEEYELWVETEEGRKCLADLGQVDFMESTHAQGSNLEEEGIQSNEVMIDMNIETGNRKRLRNEEVFEGVEISSKDQEEVIMVNNNSNATAELGII